MKNICIIGVGNMGGAMMESLKNHGFDVDGVGRGERVKECECVILAMKPQDFAEMEIGDKLVVSIMAGISIQKIKDVLGVRRVVRSMPNLGLKAGMAMTGWIASEEVSDEEKKFAKSMFKSFGEEIELQSEEKINAITALSGSGPAYYYFLTEALEKVALEMGFSDEEAKKIAAITFKGSAAIMENMSAGKLRKKITSKGGTTEEAIKKLEEGEFFKLVNEAVKAAKKRAGELNN